MHERLQIDIHYRPDQSDTLERDVRNGLGNCPRQLHPKYLYDVNGARLFDEICDTPEYYPTRTEHALLETIAEELIRGLNPASIVELGSGACRKTRTLLDAAGKWAPQCVYVPVDVSDSMLQSSAESLLERYGWLTIEGLVADYTRQLDRLPAPNGPRLFVFLGSTIGNFDPSSAVEFLAGVRAQMASEDRLLLGTDLIKASNILDAAYNDRQGLTAAFNLNVLSCLNRELGANFSLDNFQHDARFVPGPDQIEMRLRALTSHKVRFGSLDWETEFAEGETILTEISRKFSKSRVEQLLDSAGLELENWHTPENDYFALSVSRTV